MRRRTRMITPIDRTSSEVIDEPGIENTVPVMKRALSKKPRARRIMKRALSRSA